MSRDSAEEHARIADEARRKAHEAEPSAKEWAKAQARHAKSQVLTGETSQEAVRQLGLIYGGLIVIAVYMVQPFLTAPSLDSSAKVSVIAFSVAIPLLAALVMVNRQEAFRRRRTPSVSVTITQVIGQLAAFVGIVAGFWHINWIAGVVFFAAGLVGMLVHSAGYMRLEGYPDEAKRFIDEARRMPRTRRRAANPNGWPRSRLAAPRDVVRGSRSRPPLQGYYSVPSASAWRRTENDRGE